MEDIGQSGAESSLSKPISERARAAICIENIESLLSKTVTWEEAIRRVLDIYGSILPPDHTVRLCLLEASARDGLRDQVEHALDLALNFETEATMDRVPDPAPEPE